MDLNVIFFFVGVVCCVLGAFDFVVSVSQAIVHKRNESLILPFILLTIGIMLTHYFK